MVLLGLQALLASQNGWARSDSNSAEADATRPQLSPGTASEALEETESKPPSLGSSKGDGQPMSEEAGRDRDAGAEGQGRPKEPLDNREQGRDFAGWLRGRPSDASPLLVDEVSAVVFAINNCVLIAPLVSAIILSTRQHCPHQ